MPQSILDILRWRYATKNFNSAAIPQEKLNEILEATRLTPSSYGLQPWRLILITNHETLVKLHPACYNQPKLLTCNALIVFCARQDLLGVGNWLEKYLEKSKQDLKTTDEAIAGFKAMMEGTIRSLDEAAIKNWTQKQCYLAAMTAMIAAAERDVDTCPMEGFIPDQVSQILDLPKHLVPTLLLPLGYTDDARPTKTRFDAQDVVEIRE